MDRPSYDAFISYSRRDLRIARRLQRSLETLKPPPPETGRRLRIFLDSEELSASPSIRRSIRDALEQSEYLIVLASRNSAESEWVREEIDIWLTFGRQARLLFLVADGEPGRVLPTLLKNHPVYDDNPPLAADIRGSSVRESLRRLKNEYLRIAAPLLDVSFDDLNQRAVGLRLRRQRQIIASLSGILAVVLAATLVAVWQWRVAERERHTAERRLREAITVANGVLSHVDTGLRGVAGAEDLRLSLISDATEMLDRLAADTSENSTLIETQLAAHLRRGRVAADYRESALAERELEAARLLVEKIASPARKLRAITLIHRTKGELALVRKEYKEAAKHLDLADEQCQRWSAATPDAEVQRVRAELYRLRGDASAHQRKWLKAASHYNTAALRYEELRESQPQAAALRLGAALVEDRLSRIAEVQRDADKAIAHLKKAVELTSATSDGDLSSGELVQLVELYDRLSRLCERWKREDLAESFDKKALDMVFALYMTSPQNARYRRALGDAWGRLGATALKKKNFERAKTLFALRVYMTGYLLKREAKDFSLWSSAVQARADFIEASIGTGDRAAAEEQYGELKKALSNSRSWCRQMKRMSTGRSS